MPFRAVLATLATVCALGLPAPGHAEGKSIIVLDGSGSMWGQIDGRPKLEIAREALGTVLQGVPAETELGLMAYGHREKGSCEDIELIVPPARGTAQAITDAAGAMKFLGKTPLTEAVRRAAAEMRSTEEKATVILITDGIETCNADPCALGAELEASGVDFTAHVVGFGLTADEGRQVACLAENTGGTYIEASDAGTLVTALETAVATPEPEPPAPAVLDANVRVALRLAAGGPEIDSGLLPQVSFDFLTVAANGQPGESVGYISGQLDGQIPAGSHIMRTTVNRIEIDQPVDLSATELATPEVVLDAGVLSIAILSEDGGAPDPNGFWEVNGAGGASDNGYAEGLRVLPAGEYELQVSLGEMAMKQSIVITAGEVLEKTIVMGVGMPVFTAYYAPGVPVEGTQAFDILAAKPGLEGKRDRITSIYGAGASVKLPPGDYVAEASVGKAVGETAFTVEPGKRSDVSVILNAGIAAITVPSGKVLDIYEAKVALDGSRTRVTTEYGDAFQIVLPAGDYVAAVEADRASAEAPFSVKAAERTEVTVKMPIGMAAISAPGANSIEIMAAKAGLDGKRERLTNDYDEAVERLLPPGDYVAVGTAGLATAETPFTVKDGERTDVSVKIAFGVVVISAPGAQYISVEAAKTGLDGKRDRLRGDYGEQAESTLAPGDYIAVVEYKDGPTTETPFTLPEGQRLDLSLTRP